MMTRKTQASRVLVTSKLMRPTVAVSGAWLMGI